GHEPCLPIATKSTTCRRPTRRCAGRRYACASRVDDASTCRQGRLSTDARAGGTQPVNGDRLVVTGGVPLNGDVHVSGSKNAALPIMAASLLTREECTLDNLRTLEHGRRKLTPLRTS